MEMNIRIMNGVNETNHAEDAILGLQMDADIGPQIVGAKGGDADAQIH